MKTYSAFMRSSTLLGSALLLSLAVAANAATIVIFNNDGAGEGFNDPTPAAPVGGNPMNTVGGQRLFVFQHAASIWGATLPSAVTIVVTAQFNPQTCTATSAVLGSAGPITIQRDFAGAGLAGHWYHQALANRLNGTDLAPANNDINATFNSNLNGQATCLGGQGWYLGIDGIEGGNIELLPVVLHELGHGLGFSTTTNGSTGNYQSLFPSIFDFYLRDAITGQHWDQITAAQRAASALSINGLTWDGPAVFTHAQGFLSHRPRMIINSPPGIAGTYQVALGSLGPALTALGVTGNVVLADDGVAPGSDACTALINGGAIAGNIALIDRGTCTFAIKALAAQNAGAIAVLMANNVAGIQPPGGVDPAITIPVIGISQADGNTIKANLGGGVNVTCNLDPVLLAGADNSGRPLMFAPNPYQSGSSVSHYDVTLTPNALMEPAINGDLHNALDLTFGQMADIGWFDFVVATTLARFDANDRAEGIELTWQFGEDSEIGAVTVERATSEVGPWEPVTVTPWREDGYTKALDSSVKSDLTYFYRLNVMDHSGGTANFGLISARHASNVAGGNVLLAPSPNPAPRGSALSYRLAQPEFVKLAIVDATGRQVRVLENAMMAPGTHTTMWDGNAENGTKTAPGLYFVTMRTSKGLASQRLAVIR